MADTRWLEKRYLTWFAVKAVPRPLQAALGKARFVKSLHTHDIHVAIARRHAALAEFQVEIDKAKRSSVDNPLVEEGLAMRATFEAIRKGNKAVISTFKADGLTEVDPITGDERPASPQEVAKTLAEESLYGRLDELTAAGRAADANLLGGVAQGRLTPLQTHCDAWLSEGGARGPVDERTARQYRTTLKEFGAWLDKEGINSTIEAVTKAVAGQYVTALVADRANRKTANKKISALSSYWRWLTKRTAAEFNPWAGQSLPKARKPGDEPSKRTYTDDELNILLTGDPDEELADLIKIAALSGMRIEEIYQLTVADCAGGWFKIRQAKTAAGIRRLPVHSALAAIIAKRTKDKDTAAFLMHEAGGQAKPGRERSMPASKRFGRYRLACGLTDKPDGTRQDRLDFHSLRRWFVTKARDAADLAVVQAVVGHKPDNITDGVYSGGPTDDAKQACVEAVRLPSGLASPGQSAPQAQMETASPPRPTRRVRLAPQEPDGR